MNESYLVDDDYAFAYWSKSPILLESISMRSLKWTTHLNIIKNKHSFESTVLRSKAFLKFEGLILK